VRTAARLPDISYTIQHISGRLVTPASRCFFGNQRCRWPMHALSWFSQNLPAARKSVPYAQWLKRKIRGGETVQSGMSPCWLGLPYAKFEVGVCFDPEIGGGVTALPCVLLPINPYVRRTSAYHHKKAPAVVKNNFLRRINGRLRSSPQTIQNSTGG